MKKLIILFGIFVFIFPLNAEIKWHTKEEIEETYNDSLFTAWASCDTENEVLKLTKIESLDPYFYTYNTLDYVPSATHYEVVYSMLGTFIYVIKENSPVMEIYVISKLL